jgi:hypothetical protein
MKQKQFNKLAQQLTQIFQGDKLNSLARSCRFMRRERKVEPFKLMLSIISALGSGKIETLADLQRSYNFLAEQNIAYKPFHNQLSKTTFADFMRQAAEYVLEKLIQKSLSTPLKGTFSEFDRILLQDGSSFAVKDELASIYPGRFHAISPAAVELHVTYDLLNEKLEAVKITEDTASERAHLPTPSQLVGALLLADAGYFSRDYLALLMKEYARFIIKASSKINPVIESCHTPTKHNKNLLGVKLKSAFSYLSKKKPNDLTVQWQTSDGDWFTCRLIVTWNPVTQCYQYLATNLPRSRYSPAKIIEAYRLRWQIELLFKEWKSYANLKSFNTGKPQIVEGLIWGAVMAATLKRYLACCTQSLFHIDVSTRKVAMCAIHVLEPLIVVLSKTKKTGLSLALEKALNYFRTNAKRAHPKRDREKGRLKLGLTPCFA